MPTSSPRILTLFLLLCFISAAQAQCPVFTDLNAEGVECQYGTFGDPFANTGIVPGRHSIISEQGSDPRTNDQLPLLPPGESRVIKLGNEMVGGEAEAITYTFQVDAEHAILSLKFAVVFQDPNHPFLSQPRFVVRVLNEDGEITESCAEYDVTSSANISNFRTATYNNSVVRWRPWTNVGINLSDYIGRTVKLQFVTYDCDYHGHFGYAYFTAECISNRLTITECTGSTITLQAPSNFESYTWDNGSIGEQATYTVSDSGFTATCQITSATGCVFTLSAFISSDDLPTADSTFHDTICEGESYNANFFKLPVQNEVGTFLFQNNFFDYSTCGGEFTYTLHLTVQQKYYHLYDMACAGDTYNANGFNLENLSAGIVTDTLTYTDTQSGCDSIVILHLTVNPSFNLPNIITGDTHPCTRETATFQLQNAESLNTFNWIIPEGVNIVNGQGTSSITLYFSPTAPSPSSISVDGANGCGSGSVPLDIYPQSSSNIYFSDTICSGNSYHGNGFSLPRQDSVGYFTFQQDYQTQAGCDSTRVLALLVVGTPNLSIVTDTNVLCDGQSLTLRTISDHTTFIATACDIPAVAVGDIFCTDSSIIKPTAFDTAGKTAAGIVFYVDETGQHGWIVSLNQRNGIAWSNQGTDIAGLTNISVFRNVLKDFDGYHNTQIIRNAGNSSDYPAAYAVDFNNGWYLPAAGQLNVLYAQIPTINNTLQQIGVSSFNNAFWYWSSTEYDHSKVYNIDDTGGININEKTTTFSVRSIRTF